MDSLEEQLTQAKKELSRFENEDPNDVTPSESRNKIRGELLNNITVIEEKIQTATTKKKEAEKSEEAAPNTQQMNEVENDRQPLMNAIEKNYESIENFCSDETRNCPDKDKILLIILKDLHTKKKSLVSQQKVVPDYVEEKKIDRRLKESLYFDTPFNTFVNLDPSSTNETNISAKIKVIDICLEACKSSGGSIKDKTKRKSRKSIRKKKKKSSRKNQKKSIRKKPKD